MEVSAPGEQHGAGIVKLGALRQLALAPGDVDAVLTRLTTPAPAVATDAPAPADASAPTPADTPASSSAASSSADAAGSGAVGGAADAAGVVLSARTLDVLRAFEEALVPCQRPDVPAIAQIPAAELELFAQSLIDLRAERLRGARQACTAAKNPEPQDRAGENPGLQSPAGENPGLQSPAAQSPGLQARAVEEAGRAAQALNTAVVALRGLTLNTGSPPIGMLNLERIEMVPVGIERGELISTIPLAPGEETAVTHKEWSVTSQEFTTIVTDALEEVSETGVTDNTDLSQSTTSQSQHSNQFNITGTVQGGIPIISGSSTSGFTSQGSTSESANESIKHAHATTQKASSRSRREHKVTISTTTVTGESETSTRVLKNTQKDPIRIDYFSLMRKWRVRLYRYGLRLTYDLVVPEPGAAMRRAYAELDVLRAQQGPFVFGIKPSEVSTELVDANGKPDVNGKPRYVWLAERYNVVVRPYPGEPVPVPASTHVVSGGGWHFLDLEFEVPGGTQIRDILLNAQIGHADGDDEMNFEVMGAHGEREWGGLSGPLFIRDYQLKAIGGVNKFLAGYTGRQKITFFSHHAADMFVGLTVNRDLTAEAIEQWRTEVWNTLFNAAQAAYYARQEEIGARIAGIEEQLTGVDTLSLRREESDEIMKSVLRFVLGSDFDFMPAEVLAAFTAAGVDLVHGVGFDGPSLGLNAEQWSILRQHEDLIRFINQAIEWENVVTFLYSYFWDVPPSWPFIRRLRHHDPNRQAFLRAGSARIVLTVRKGWEERWMRYAEGGSIGAPIPQPYLTIAREIAAYDDRNYPGIPPANPGRSAVHLQDEAYTTFKVDAGPSDRPVNLKVASSAGFVEGLPVVIDVQDGRGIQEAQVVIDIPDSTHLTVARLDHAHRGTAAAVPVVQPGEKGALIAEWNEYTPSSGTDIAVTSNLTTIA
ncbi:hypothetical protein AB0I81_49300 [Nonomuraea sp. NPDC050404]|uniref:hypothetical protein n=1 Tax=Nonomuraea sp. NPDC050404 TaxID=3155783 RepID=UPI0033CEEDEA